jgi:predicted ATPase
VNSNLTQDTRVRDKWDVDDGRWLKEDAANIAPFLYRLQRNEPKHYQRIVDTIRLILPFFATFELEPEYGRLLLQWRELGSDRIFSASQAADGMLRAIALVALLSNRSVTFRMSLSLTSRSSASTPMLSKS